MRRKLIIGVVLAWVATVATAAPASASCHHARPTVSSVSPAVLSTGGGTIVTVRGRGFTAVLRVDFGRWAGRSLEVDSSTELTVVAPAHAQGAVDVRVLTAHGTSRRVPGDRVTYRVPTLSWNAPTPISARSAKPVSVSCQSTGACVAVEASGAATTFDGSSWSPPLSLQTGDLSSVSCATPMFCVAVGGGNAFTYNGTAWSVAVDVDPSSNPYHPSNLTAVSCPTSTFCVAIDAAGNAFTWGGTAWTPYGRFDFPASEPDSVSCPTAGFCVAVDGFGRALTYNGTTWSGPVGLEPNGVLVSVSCPSTGFCVAVDANANAFTYNGAAWSAGGSLGAGLGLSSVSCATSGFCVAVGFPVDSATGYPLATGDAVVYRGSTWAGPHGMDPDGSMSSVSCPAVDHCVAVDSTGHAVLGH